MRKMRPSTRAYSVRKNVIRSGIFDRAFASTAKHHVSTQWTKMNHHLADLIIDL